MAGEMHDAAHRFERIRIGETRHRHRRVLRPGRTINIRIHLAGMRSRRAVFHPESAVKRHAACLIRARAHKRRPPQAVRLRNGRADLFGNKRRIRGIALRHKSAEARPPGMRMGRGNKALLLRNAAKTPRRPPRFRHNVLRNLDGVRLH